MTNDCIPGVFRYVYRVCSCTDYHVGNYVSRVPVQDAEGERMIFIAGLCLGMGIGVLIGAGIVFYALVMKRAKEMEECDQSAIPRDYVPFKLDKGGGTQ